MTSTTRTVAQPTITHLPHLHLGLTMESLLAGIPLPSLEHASPWDAWWVAYRLAQPARALDLDPLTAPGACPMCRKAAAELTHRDPPAHTDRLTSPCPDGCLTRWATAMRAPAPRLHWPTTRLTSALLKPGAPAQAITDDLAEYYTILFQNRFLLSVGDVRRLYPEAYGAQFVAARDAYLTSGPVDVLILLARRNAAEPAAIKRRIRTRFDAETLRNHIHMADNPGEAFADIAHLAGYPLLAELYDTHERHHTSARLAAYRALLGR